MKRVKMLIALLALPMIVLSQSKKFEYTPKVKNRVKIVNLLGKVVLKNAKGNSIVIESNFNINKPERAKGLKLLGISEDNTELGINIQEQNGDVEILGVTKKVKDYDYTIYIPKGIVVNIDYSSPFADKLIEVNSYDGSVEIKTLSSDVKLNNCTGPFTVSSISGNIEADFRKISQKEPSSFASVSGLLDVTLPSNLKATFVISSVSGDIYNNLNLINSEIKKDKRSNGLRHLATGNKGKYELNGGGQKMILKSVSGDIYLRKN